MTLQTYCTRYTTELATISASTTSRTQLRRWLRPTPSGRDFSFGSVRLSLRQTVRAVTAISIAYAINDLPSTEGVLHRGKRSDILGGVVFQDHEIRFETYGDSPQLF